MFAAAVRIDLRVPNVQSLKEKRAVLKAVMNHLTTSFPVGIAEVDHQDLWQRATIGVAAVAPQLGQLDRMLHTLERAIRNRPDVEVLGVAVSHLEDPD